MVTQSLPTRFHIGTQKAGSTFLYNLLKSHPDVALSAQTEVHYYSKHFDRGDGWYQALFPETGVKIDTSPKYFMNGELAAPRIATACGRDARLYLLLRNPIDLLNSHYQMHVLSNHFARRPDLYPVVPTDVVDCIERYPDFLKQARYATALEEHWFPHFERSQLKIDIFEAFVADVPSHTAALLAFWDLPAHELTAARASRNQLLRSHSLFKARAFVVRHPRLKQRLQHSRIMNWLYRTYLTRPSRETITLVQRNALAAYLADDVAALRTILNRDLAEWSDFKPEATM